MFGSGSDARKKPYDYPVVVAWTSMQMIHCQAPRRGLTQHGRLLKLGADIKTVNSSPNASRFLMYRSGSDDELRRTVDGEVIATSERKVKKAEFISAANTGFLVTHHARKPSIIKELRRVSDGSVIPLKQDAGDLFFNPPAGLVVVDNYGMVPDEVRRTDDGALLTLLDAPVSGAFFSPNVQERVFIVKYHDAPGEILNLGDGSLLSPLADVVRGVEFSPEPEANTLLSGTRKHRLNCAAALMASL